MKIEARPWRPQDLLDDLQQIIDEEPDRYLNTRRTTLCMALDYLKEHFTKRANEPLTLEELREIDGEPVWCGPYAWKVCYGVSDFRGYPCLELGGGEAISLVGYGESWLAYRYKPDGGADGWISVEDHLPEPGKEVLLLAHGWEGRLHYIGKLAASPSQEGFFGKSKASEWTIWGWSYFREPKVTHWMPLPEPPESKVGGEQHGAD